MSCSSLFMAMFRLPDRYSDSIPTTDRPKQSHIHMWTLWTSEMHVHVVRSWLGLTVGNINHKLSTFGLSVKMFIIWSWEFRKQSHRGRFFFRHLTYSKYHCKYSATCPVSTKFRGCSTWRNQMETCKLRQYRKSGVRTTKPTIFITTFLLRFQRHH